jgi:hypothetical protein
LAAEVPDLRPDPWYAVSIRNSYGVAVALQPDGEVVTAGTRAVITTNGPTGFAFALGRLLPSEPQIGSFTASPDPVAAGSSPTLTASSISDANPGAPVTQVAFSVQMHGADTLLGYGTQTSPGAWTLTFTVNRTPGNYPLLAVAQGSGGGLGDPDPLMVQVLSQPKAAGQRSGLSLSPRFLPAGRSPPGPGGPEALQACAAKQAASAAQAMPAHESPAAPPRYVRPGTPAGRGCA